MSFRPLTRRGLLASAGAALALALLAAPAGANAADDAWAAMVERLDALIAEAEADNVRMGATVIDLSGVYNDAVATVGSQVPYKAASIIKLPILGLLMRKVDAGELSLDTVVTIQPGDINIVGGSGTLRNREFPASLTIDELATLMVIVSDNTATNVLIDVVGGFAPVNEYIASLGYTSMWLGRKMINPATPPLNENWINSAVVADFIARLYRHEILSPESSEYIIQIMREQLVNTKFGAVIPREVLGNKTGELGDTSHDSGIIFVPGHEVALAVTTEFMAGRQRATVDVYVQRAATIVYEFLLQPIPAE